MNEQLVFLISIQEIDAKIFSITEEIELLPDKLGAANARLNEINTAFEKVKDEFKKSEKKRKQKEGELEELQEKLNKLRAKSTEIKTNKEYEAHLKEIKTFEDNQDKIEEEILYIMETLDTLTMDKKKEESKFREEEENFKKEEKILAEEKQKLSSGMEGLKAKREELADRIDEELYAQYMSIKKGAGGVAVVETKNEVCFGCHTNIPPQLYNDIRTNQEIYTCYNCNRFLFYSVVEKPHEAEMNNNSSS